MTIEPADVLFEAGPRTEAEVSVAITCFNYRDYILEALDSVEAQTLEAIDLVVVDDASTDDGIELTMGWLEENGGRFGRATLLRHRRNHGLAAARNQGFGAARSPWVFALDADNAIYPRCLEVCLAAALEEQADAVYTLTEIFGEEQGVMGTDPWDPEVLQRGNYIDAMALVHRGAWQEVGGYRRMPCNGWEDYDFWMKFAEVGMRVCRVPEILCRYRRHAGSMLRMVTNRPGNIERLHADMKLHHPSFQP